MVFIRSIKRFKWIGLALPLVGTILLAKSLSVPATSEVNVRENVTLTANFVDRSARLSYTIYLASSVDTVRSRNFVFERNGEIPIEERLEYCHFMNGSHICTDNNYPIVMGINGLIQVQEASGNTDRWTTEKKHVVSDKLDCGSMAFPENVLWEC